MYDLCWQKVNQYNDQQGVLNQDIDLQVYQYQKVVEEILVNREKTVVLIGSIETNTPIPSAILDAPNLRLQTALDIIGRVVRVIDSNQCWQEFDSNRVQESGLLALDPSCAT